MAVEIRRIAVPSAGAGGRVHLVEIVGRVEAAREAVTLWLAVPGTLQAPAAYRPGQFVTLALPTASGTTLYRSYSLCGDGREDRPWEITVKRQPGGAVSPFLYAAARPGMRLYTSAPQGVFTLPPIVGPHHRLVFVALGSGITPIYAMLRSLAGLAPERRPNVCLHYAYSSAAGAIYGRVLAALDPERRWLTQWHYDASAGRRISVEQVLSRSAGDVTAGEWYVCGPANFRRALVGALTQRGVAQARAHVEVFASPRAPAPRAADIAGEAPAGLRRAVGVRVRLANTGAVLEGRRRETLLEILERNGCHPDSSCRAGACGTCRLRLLAGHVQGGRGGRSRRRIARRDTF